MDASTSREELIEFVLALSRADRNAVLDRLSPEARQVLLPMLEQAKRTDFSKPFLGLIAGITDAGVQNGMTSTGTAALRKAYDVEATAVQSERTSNDWGFGEWLGRKLELLGMRG